MAKKKKVRKDPKGCQTKEKVACPLIGHDTDDGKKCELVPSLRNLIQHLARQHQDFFDLVRKNHGKEDYLEAQRFKKTDKVYKHKGK